MSSTSPTIAAAIALSLCSASSLFAAGGCLLDGECTQTTALQCVQLGGTFLGEGASCNSTDCGSLGAGSCFVPHATNGCSIVACCFTVCEIDLFCCEQVWDIFCATQATQLCGGCGSATSGNCFVANGTPGCNSSACCTEVCLSDPVCCETGWDNLCATGAAILCAGCGDAEAESCFIAHAGTGCDSSDCCADICAIDPFCCLSEWDSACAGAAAADCAGCGTTQAGSCFNANGSPGCALLECCTLVCATDAFCCETAWDFFCANQAIEFCASCGGEAAGDCFTPNQTPGCRDAACCEVVCGIDSFCCDQFWDFTCTERATELCGFCGAPGAGDCLIANGSPACNDLGCCAQVCQNDSFCCQTTWDQVCANEATEICCLSACTGDLDGNGVVDGGDLGVLLGAFGGSGTCADFDGNGEVNGADLGILLGAWGDCDK